MYTFFSQVPYMQIRENNWTVNADANGRWNVRYDLWGWRLENFMEIICVTRCLFYLLGFCYPATELRLVNGIVLVWILNPQFILSCLFFLLFICKCLYGHGCWWGGGSNVSPRFCGRCLIVKVCTVEVVPMLEIGN